MAEFQWSAEQKRIIEERGHNILVSAAAGSGKTAVLIERIFQRIMDLENPVQIDQFVVVTFTKAAAAQMKDRLRERMEEMVAEYGVEKGYSYLICDPVAGGSAMFALRYCMNTSRVQQVAITAPAQMDIEKDYDYVFLLDTENPILEQWVLENYPEQAGRTVIQCIK